MAHRLVLGIKPFLRDRLADKRLGGYRLGGVAPRRPDAARYLAVSEQAGSAAGGAPVPYLLRDKVRVEHPQRGIDMRQISAGLAGAFL